MHRRAQLVLPQRRRERATDTIERTGHRVARGLRFARIRFDPVEAIAAMLPPRIEDFDLGSEAFAAATVPAANGHFTARSLARLYAMLAGGGELDGVRILSEETVSRAGEVQNRGIGRVGIGSVAPTARLHVIAGDEMAADFSNGSGAPNATVRAKNFGGTAGAFFSQIDYLVDVPTCAVLGAAGPGATGGYFRSEGTEDALVGESFGMGSAVTGISSGGGHAGYFAGGPGVRVAGQADVDAFRMAPGAVDGYVLTTDGAGSATWACARRPPAARC